MGASEGGYQIVSDAVELERLRRQGQILAPATRLLFTAAGLRPGMRVLDLGSGAGDVSFVAAELVGPSGAVVGVERSPESVATAKARAKQQGLANVSFAVGDIHETTPGGPFDAIVCRLTLLYVPDPAVVLRAQAAQLRPGGVVAPIEFDIHSAGSLPPTPLVGQLLGWIRETFERVGIDPALGPRLWAVLQDAGLRPLGMLGVQPHSGPHDPDGPFLLAGYARAVLPLIEKAGVATAQQVGADTLQTRLAEELASNNAVFALPVLRSAWGTRA
jgi:SAM-dependent methyltransferase